MCMHLYKSTTPVGVMESCGLSQSRTFSFSLIDPQFIYVVPYYWTLRLLPLFCPYKRCCCELPHYIHVGLLLIASFGYISGSFETLGQRLWTAEMLPPCWTSFLVLLSQIPPHPHPLGLLHLVRTVQLEYFINGPPTQFQCLASKLDPQEQTLFIFVSPYLEAQ